MGLEGSYGACKCLKWGKNPISCSHVAVNIICAGKKAEVKRTPDSGEITTVTHPPHCFVFTILISKF